MEHRNLIIARLPAEIADDIMGSGADFELSAGSTMKGEQLVGDQLFIISSGVASKFQIASSGRFSEIGMIGHEGMFPLASMLGVRGAPHIMHSQIGILRGRRVRTKDFQRIIASSDEARHVILTYAYAFVMQICANLVAAEQPVYVRLARWILMCHDRVGGAEIAVTHDDLAMMTLSHRPTVTLALQAMKDAQLIVMTRGNIDVIDREGLIAASAGSYGHAEEYWHENLVLSDTINRHQLNESAPHHVPCGSQLAATVGSRGLTTSARSRSGQFDPPGENLVQRRAFGEVKG